MKLLGLKPPDWKVARWLGALLILGLLLLSLRGVGQSPPAVPASTGQVASPPASDAADPVAVEERSLSASLESVLSQIEGAGRVSVRVSLAAGNSRKYAADTTTDKTTTVEKDSGGGTRTTTQDNVQQKVDLANNAPVTVQVSRPEVNGVLVVASGAGNAAVREELAQAAAAALGLPLYQVVVLPSAPVAGNGGA